MYTVNIDDIASRGIVDYMKDNKFEFAEVKDTVFGPLPDETLTLYEMPNGTFVIETNGDPVWDYDVGFDDLMTEYFL